MINKLNVKIINATNTFLFLKNNKQTKHAKIEKTLMINNNKKCIVYIRNIFAKNYYLKQKMQPKNIIFKLFEKMNINLNNFKKYDIIKIKKCLLEKDILKFLCCDFNVKYDLFYTLKYVQINYEKIIKNIMKDVNIDFNNILSYYIFNNSNIYNNYLVNIFSMSIVNVLKKKNLTPNTNVVNFLLQNIILYYGSKNFGICYMTKSYIAKQLLCNYNTVMQTMNKLEFCGMINYIAADIQKKKYELHDILIAIKNKKCCSDEEKEEIKKYENIIKQKVIKNKNVLLFPVINFDVLLEHVVPHFVKLYYDSILYDLKNRFYNFLTDFIIDYVKNNNYANLKKLEEKDYILFYNNYKKNIEKMKNGKIYNKKICPIKKNIYKYYKTKFCDKYTNKKMFCANMKIDDNVKYINYFIDRKKKCDNRTFNGKVNLNFDDIIESTHFVIKYFKDILFIFALNNNYLTLHRKNVNRKLLLSFIKKNKLENKFINFIGSNFQNKLTQLYEDNKDVFGGQELYTFDLLKNLMINYQLGIVDEYKRKKCISDKNVRSQTSFLNKEFIKNLDKEKHLCDITINTHSKLLNKINKMKNLDKEKVQKYIFPIYEVIKQTFINSKNKFNFIFNMQYLLVGRRKNPIVIYNNLVELLYNINMYDVDFIYDDFNIGNVIKLNSYFNKKTY